MTGPIQLPVSLPPAVLHLLSVQQILADLARLGEQEGSVLRQLADGRTQVRIGSRTVDLELGTALEPGTRFTARLVQGKLVLNLAPDTAAYTVHRRVFDPGIREPALEITVRSLVQSLQDLGLPGDRGNLAIAQAILMAAAPVTRELIERLRRQLGEISGSEIEALAVFLRKRVPFDAALVGQTAQALEAKGSVARALSDLAGARGSIPDGSPLGRSLGRLAAWLGSRSVERAPGLLGEWLRESGLFFEAGLARGDEPGDDLKRILSEIVREADSFERDGEGAREAGAISEQARLLLDLVAQQQIASLDEPDSHERTWSAVLPLLLDGETTTLHLIVREEKTGGGDAERPVEVMLRWELSTLGEVSGRLRQSGDSLSVTVGADSEWAVRYIRENLPALEESLSGIGYSKVRVRSGSSEAGETDR